ncbi:MAG: hypothetical protein KC457_37600, partial [Myxococcales bacterium]|nr:hypothetical protein [Myxococcales bacterium]
LGPLDDVPADVIDAWLHSDALADRLVRLHRDLLWNNVSDVQLVSVSAGINASAGIWGRGGTQAIFYRGANVRCLDQPATWDADGQIETTLMPDGSRREGWVWVEPYWAPGTQVKACAFDAQDALVSSSGTDCATPAGFRDRECGCGPSLRTCMPNEVRLAVTEAMAKDVD